MRPNGAWMVVIGFVATVLLGTLLLSLPVATTNNQPLPLLSALFTATSATCVTGLMVVDAGTELSLFGQTILLILIQVGGLGIITFGTFLMSLVGRRLSVNNEFTLMDAYGTEKVNNIRALLGWILVSTIIIEMLGTLVLWGYYQKLTSLSQSTALYYAAFHAISAFCNAGISLHTHSLSAFQQSTGYLATIGVLVVSGGLGFAVLYNLLTFKFWKKTSEPADVSLCTPKPYSQPLLSCYSPLPCFF